MKKIKIKFMFHISTKSKFNETAQCLTIFGICMFIIQKIHPQNAKSLAIIYCSCIETKFLTPQNLIMIHN